MNTFIKGNESSNEQQFQLKMLDRTNMWKLIFGIGGSSAIIFALIKEGIKLIFK